MNDLQMWSLVVGTLAPTLIAVLQQPWWPKWARTVVTALFCLVAGGVTAWLSGELTGRGVATAVLLVLVAALATYRSLWKPSGVTDAIEIVTTSDRRLDDSV